MERQDKDLMVSAETVEKMERKAKKKFTKEKVKNVTKNAIIGVLVAIIVLLLMFCLKSCNSDVEKPVSDGQNVQTEQNDKNDKPKFSTEVDKNAQDSTSIGKSLEAIQDELNAQAAASDIIISVLDPVVLKDGNSLARIGVINEPESTDLQVVQLYLNDSDDNLGQLIYQSGIIPIGHSIEYVPLNIKLDKGVYKGTFVINAVTENGDYVKQGRKKAHIIVEN